MKILAPSYNIPEKLLPETASASTILKRTMEELFGKAKTLVKPLDGAQGYALMVRGKDDKGKPKYDTAWSCKVATGNVLEFDGDVPASDQEDLTDFFEQSCACLSCDDIGSAWLARKIMPELHAVRLRDTGGIYFVPAASVPMLHNIRALLLDVSKHYLEEIPAMRTEEAVDAVLRSIEAECETTAEELENEVTSWASAAGLERKTRKSTMTNRAVKAEQTEQKIKLYEELLGQRLDGLHQKFGLLQARISQAILASDAEI